MTEIVTIALLVLVNMTLAVLLGMELRARKRCESERSKTQDKHESERRALQTRNEQLSDACLQIVKQHSSELVRAEERHMLTHDAAVRNILASLERAASNRPPK